MHSLTLLYDFGETKVQQRNFIAKGNKRKHRFLQVRLKEALNKIKREGIMKADRCHYPDKRFVRIGFQLRKSACSNTKPLRISVLDI